MTKEVTLQDIALMIEAQNQRFNTIDAQVYDLKQDISGLHIGQIKLNKLYNHMHDNILDIATDIKNIYDRLVLVEERTH